MNTKTKAAAAEIIVKINDLTMSYEANAKNLVGIACIVARQIKNNSSSASYTTVSLDTVEMNLENIVYLGGGEFAETGVYSQLAMAKHYLHLAKKQLARHVENEKRNACLKFSRCQIDFNGPATADELAVRG